MIRQARGIKCDISRKTPAPGRHKSGASLLEIPLMLWVVLIAILMPMLALATITLKSALMNAAVQDGAFLASKAKTFQVGTSEKPAAITLAESAIKGNAAKYPGLEIIAVKTTIVTTPITGGSSSRVSSKLSAPADTSKNIYQIETVATGRIQPLFQVNGSIVGSIPGVTNSIPIEFTAREMAENPQGLDK